MKPLLFNALRHYLAALLLLPGLALAQPMAPEIPCTPVVPAPPAVSVTVAVPEVPAVPMFDIQTGQTNGNCQNAEEQMVFSSEKRKTFEKTYKVSKSDVLSIENKFGNVHVNTWNRNEIQVKVEIIGRANSDQAAQDLLSRINIAESRSGSTITVKTVMESIQSNRGDKSFEINYTINMPDDNQVAIKNSFGNVYLPDMKGKVDLTVRHGAFKTGNLANTSNSIKASYCTGSANSIGYLNQGAMDLAYSTVNVGGTNGINGSSKFSDLRIGNLSESLDMDVKYGSFRVDNVKRNFKNISVNGGFTPIQFHFENDSAFDFNVNVQFADFKVDRDLVKFTTLQKGHTSAEYKGRFGTSSSKGSISITSKYNDVKFTK